ncbi:MAG: hypothetical protein IJQ25_10170 [Oscillibacter sp.]|nr:hypothetical protein [Oscillibacter sp.]
MARIGVDWDTTIADESDALQSYLGISILAEDKQDLEDFTELFTGGSSFDVTLTSVQNAGKLTEGDTITFGTIAEFSSSDDYTVTVTDSSGNDLSTQWTKATGVLKVGSSLENGGAFAYDGDRHVTFKISTAAGKDVASVSYRFDVQGTALAKDTEANLSLKTSDGLNLQIGDDANAWNIMNVSVSDIHAEALGIANIDISAQGQAQAAMNALKDAINYVSDVRGGLGATQNRLEHTINNLSVMQENIQDAESTIRDTDVADEMMKYTKNSILVQSAQAMLAQANQQPQGVLQLLQ